jgi:LCP family protein required for cell wall assembly
LIRESRDIMRKKVKWTLLSIGTLVLIFLGYYLISIYSSLNHFNKSTKDSIFTEIEKNNPITSDIAPPTWEGTQRVNILVLGGDERGLDKTKGEVPRSDSMMVVSIEPNTKKAILISILRDTYVKIPGHGQDRINAALALGGPTLAMKTVSNLLDIPIQYYVYMGFKGFIGVVDALGGVQIDVEKDMYWSDSEDNHIYDINLKKGLQELDGKTALQYVRFRHDARSDFARADRQQKFLTAISEKMQTASGIIKLPKILSAIDPYIETNISVSEMLKLGSLGMESKASGFAGIQVPPLHLLEERRINGASVLTTNPELIKGYIQDKFIESLTGVEQPLVSMRPTATSRPDPKPTSKPVPTKTPAPTVRPTPTAVPVVPSESEQPTPSGGPTESVQPGESTQPTPSPTATTAPVATPKAPDVPQTSSTPKPVIKVE